MKTLAIIRREYVERVRSKSFLIATILLPVLMGLSIGLPILLSDQGAEEQRNVGLIDPSAEILEPLRRSLAGQGLDNFALVTINIEGRSLEDGLAEMRSMILDEVIDSGVVVGPDYIEHPRATFYGKSVSSMLLLDEIRPALDRVLRETRFDNAGVPDSLHVYLDASTVWNRMTVTAEGEEARQDEGSAFMMALTLIMILYMMVVVYGQHTLTGVIEEKSSRVVEVILSSVPSRSLMLGKVVGIGLAGLTQMAIWAASILYLSGRGVSVAGLTIDASVLSPIMLVSFLVFFVLGFFMFAMLYAGVGALCNTVQESQQFATPIVMFAVIPMLLLAMVLRAPDSTLAVVLSLIPLFSPILMFMRVCLQTPPIWQIVLSWALMGATIWLLTRLAGKLFRVGILAHGSAPSWASVMRILKQPD